MADARVNDLQALVPGMIDFIESRGVNSYNGAPYPKILIRNIELIFGLELEVQQ